MNFTPDFLDEIRARLPVSEVVMRQVKLQRRGREFVGLSPFNAEKTPSFTVNDQKGFYHCFSSGKHGDIFRFVMETEGLSFPEAVERLASDAGVPMPERSDHDREREKRRLTLLDVMTKAATFFEQSLQAPEAAAARQYLEGRGLAPPSWKRFGIGYAPPGRYALKQYLASAGIDQALMAESGMLIAGEDIAVSYDRFRDRIIFPITDLQNRVIAFGGRAMNPDVPAKYLNSPETPLFHKGAILYNHAAARKAAYDAGGVIVAEGYMDVIALNLAGFDHAVAPLGTALTERQLQLIWRMAPEPVLCFDGDKAGLRAAFRALDLALPHLKAGYSLRFALLPEGLDPDDLIRDKGREAMAEILAKAHPLSAMLWSREVQAGSWNTPERRAALEKNLEAKLSEITDPKVRHHYAADLKNRLSRLWGSEPARQPRAGQPRPRAAAQPRAFGRDGRPPASQGLMRPPARLASGLNRREVLLALAPIHFPEILDRFTEKLAELDFSTPELDRLRQSLLDAAALPENLDRSHLIDHLADRGHGPALARLEQAEARAGNPMAAYVAKTGNIEGLIEQWLQAEKLHKKHTSLLRELHSTEMAFGQDMTDENFARMKEIRAQIDTLEGLEAAHEEQDV